MKEKMEWKDMNGNTHIINSNIELSLQQPNCKYLLPCGICTSTSSMNTCSLLRCKESDQGDSISRAALKQSIRKIMNERYISWSKTVTVADIADLIFDVIDMEPNI